MEAQPFGMATSSWNISWTLNSFWIWGDYLCQIFLDLRFIIFSFSFSKSNFFLFFVLSKANKPNFFPWCPLLDNMWPTHNRRSFARNPPKSFQALASTLFQINNASSLLLSTLWHIFLVIINVKSFALPSLQDKRCSQLTLSFLSDFLPLLLTPTTSLFLLLDSNSTSNFSHSPPSCNLNHNHPTIPLLNSKITPPSLVIVCISHELILTNGLSVHNFFSFSNAILTTPNLANRWP